MWLGTDHKNVGLSSSFALTGTLWGEVGHQDCILIASAAVSRCVVGIGVQSDIELGILIHIPGLGSFGNPIGEAFGMRMTQESIQVSRGD